MWDGWVAIYLSPSQLNSLVNCRNVDREMYSYYVEFPFGGEIYNSAHSRLNVHHFDEEGITRSIVKILQHAPSRDQEQQYSSSWN